MIPTWHTVFMLVSGSCLAAGAAPPGCDCPLSTCCPPDASVPELERHLNAPPAVCELLRFSNNASAVCNDNGMGTEKVCGAVLSGLNERFSAESSKGFINLGRFIGEGTCALLRDRCLIKEPVRMDYWREEQVWPTTQSATIDFEQPGYGILQWKESCNHDEILLEVEATWTPEGQSATKFAIAEASWKSGGDDILSWFCADFPASDNAKNYYALYLKIGDSFPCKTSAALKQLEDAMLNMAIFVLIG